MLELTLIPAYGRDYATQEQCLADWNAGKDFQIATAAHPGAGRYTSIRDVKTFPGEHVKIRFNKLEDYVLVRLSDVTPNEESPDKV